MQFHWTVHVVPRQLDNHSSETLARCSSFLPPNLVAANYKAYSPCSKLHNIFGDQTARRREEQWFVSYSSLLPIGSVTPKQALCAQQRGYFKFCSRKGGSSKMATNEWQMTKNIQLRSRLQSKGRSCFPTWVWLKQNRVTPEWVALATGKKDKVYRSLVHFDPYPKSYLSMWFL